MGDYCLECWKLQNETLHGKEQEESRKKKLTNMQTKVKYLYKKKEELQGSKNLSIFDMPLYKQSRFGVQSITLWVGMAEEVLKLHRENAVVIFGGTIKFLSMP